MNFKIYTSDILLCICFTLSIYLFITYYWNKRWLYFYSLKLPGPISLPIIGNAYLMLEGRKEAINTIARICKEYRPVVRVWIGEYLLIGTVRLQDIEIILSKNLDKGDFYDLTTEFFKNSLLIAPVNLWRERRKIINQTFNTPTINSFFPILNKYAKNLNPHLEQFCEANSPDIFRTIWEVTLESACETLGDVDAQQLKEKKTFLASLYRYEEILVERFYNPILRNNFFWKLSNLQKEAVFLSNSARDFVKQIINLQKNETTNTKTKKFFPFLNELVNARKLSKEVILEEGPLMLLASSETSAVVTSTVLLIMGMYPQVQEKIFQELKTVLGDTRRDLVFEDVAQLEYLERVMKETMRILPPVPFFIRMLDKDYHIEPYVYPKGAQVLFPITNLHHDPDLWPEPEKFDPDRFLPDEIRKRSRFAYIPFSYGARNCIGFRYALLSVKILLANILKTYKVIESLDYQRIEDMEHFFMIVSKAKKGYRVRLEKR